MPEMVTVSEAQRLLRVGRRTVLRHRAELGAVRFGGQWRFPRARVLALVMGEAGAP